jgi:hypothetical protein
MSAASPGHSNDLTMELPIFRELESAWFRTDQPPVLAVEPARRDYAADPGLPGGAESESFPRSGASPSSSTQRTEWTGGTDSVGRGADAVSWRSIADDGWLAARAALDPLDGGSTEMGLPRRVPMAQLVPGGVEAAPPGSPERRTPDSVRGLLSAYHRGVTRGRDAHGNGSGPTSTDPQNSGREQEA